MYRAKLLLLLCLLPASASSQPTEAPNLPANLRSLVPRGWVATSFAEVDMNKDGNLDRAVLLAPVQHDDLQLGPIHGTPLRDRCRNLLLLVGQPNGLPAVANYLPWSKQTQVKERQRLSEEWNSLCADGTGQATLSGHEDMWTSPLLMRDELSTVRNTLRYIVGNQTDDYGKTLVIRVEQDCLRLIGAEFSWYDGDDTNNSSSASINYLTCKRIDESDTQLETLDRNGEYKRDSRSTTTTISQSAPICLNDRPIPAPSVPPLAATPQTKVPIPVPPQASPARSAPSNPRTPSPLPTPNRPPTAASSSNAPAGPMTVEELWRNPPPGSRISWARWSDGKEESYLRLPDGTLFRKDGVFIWSRRGTLQLSTVKRTIVGTDKPECPDTPWGDEEIDEERLGCRGESSWERIVATDLDGRRVWGGFTTSIDEEETLDSEYMYERYSDGISTSDSVGILIYHALNGEYGGAHPTDEYSAEWVDPATGQSITRVWPQAALAGAQREFMRPGSVMNYDVACSDINNPACVERHQEAKRELLESGGPLKPGVFEPLPVCGRVQRWNWNLTLSLSYAKRLYENQPVKLSVPPTDIEPNPIVDCTYRPGFDGPSAVGWSAVVR